jgi:hypothetical protein
LQVRRVVLVIGAMLLPTSTAESQESKGVRAARVAGQLVLGAGVGWLAGMAAWSVLENPSADDYRVKGDAGYSPRANVAYALGSFVGATATVQLIGAKPRPAVWKTAIGAFVPTIWLLAMRDEPYLPLIGLVVGAPLQAIGATVVFHSTKPAR